MINENGYIMADTSVKTRRGGFLSIGARIRAVNSWTVDVSGRRVAYYRGKVRNAREIRAYFRSRDALQIVTVGKE